MTDEAKALVERLRALHVWPQAVADDHADLLTPRQIDKLYEVGRVSHEAADRIEALEAENERLREALQDSARALDASNVLIHALSGAPSVMVETFAERTRAALAGDSHDQ